jgi:hypothetical protein
MLQRAGCGRAALARPRNSLEPGVRGGVTRSNVRACRGNVARRNAASTDRRALSMTRTCLRPALALCVLVPLAFTAPARAQGLPLEFRERFALADDRPAALELLLPGSEEAFFYRCLWLQHEGELDAVAELLPQWIESHGRSARVEQIENRQALLGWERDPEATYAFLRRRLGLAFDHERDAASARADLPSRLDPALLDRAALERRAFELHPGTLQGLRDTALPRLDAAELAPELLHQYLKRLERPDVPGLAQLVVRDLERERGPAFGSLTIHNRMLEAQYAECARLRPALRNEPAFVEAWLERLRPGADVDLERDAAAREAWLERLEAFVTPLPPVHDSLEAHVLHHRLAHDLAAGRPDERRLRAYLRLPRRSPWSTPESLRASGAVVDPARTFATGLPPVGDDEALVRASLALLLRDADSHASWSELVRDDWLRRLFAETKILAGVGPLERWTALADDPAWLAALEARVEIEFAPTQPRHHGARDPVALEVDLKHVDTLLVKVFEVDAFNWYRARDAEVDASIPLDGLVANHEFTLDVGAGALRRVRRRIELPQIERPGVYVVELIGNGMSSRAVIHKGRLELVQRTGSAGHVLRVVDEEGAAVPEATLWFAGREVLPDADGLLRIPFSTEPGTKAVILRHGERASLARLEHLQERYELTAAVFVERESLLSRARAKLLVRPTLSVHGRPVDLGLLEDAVLSISSVDGTGTTATQELHVPELTSNGEFEHEIAVPEGLLQLGVRLRGRVRSLSEQRDLELESPEVQFGQNAIDATEATACTLLGRTARGWHLDVLGRNGEPKPGRALHVHLELRDFTDPVSVSLATDARGRIELGSLEGVLKVHTDGPESPWDLSTQSRTVPERVHGVVGETLRVPYQGRATSPSRAAFALLELRGGVLARDAFEHLAIERGFLELRDLPAGDFLLRLEEFERQVEVRVTAGASRDGWAFGRTRRLELGPRAPLAVRALAAAAGELTVQLDHAGPDARVHVFATRYRPTRDPFARLVAPPTPVLATSDVEREPSSYHAGRELGDEYRYVLERRAARKFPGNMLSRPGLLLNPWSLGETDADPDDIGAFGGRFGGRKNLRARGGGSSGQETAFSKGKSRTFPDLDFLPRSAPLLANLRPDADGVVRVPLAELGDGQEVHVVAVDARETVYVSLALEERPLAPADQRLARALDVTRHFAEQRRVEFVDAGATARIEDAGSSRAETYDSLATVYRLFRTLQPQAGLEEFEFLLRWPALGDDEKRALYSEHACHELHVFLQRKDPRFFEEVVRPYLANKAHKTFLDRWLLGEDLARYLDPWSFGRLNVLERILLSERIEGERAAVARHVREAVEARPVDARAERALFDAALAGAALDTQARLGESMRRAAEAEPEQAEDRSGPATPGPGGPGAPAGGARAAAKAEASEALGDKAFNDVISTGSDEFFLGRGEQQGTSGVAADAERDQDSAARERVRALYRAPERTQAWVESDYWHVRAADAGPDLIEADPFWLDFAERDRAASFRSPHFAHAAGSRAEMLLALAVLDLPFEAGEHALEVAGRSLSLRAASPLLLVRRDVLEARPAEDTAPLLMSQDLYRLDEPWRDEGGERRDAFVTGALQPDVAYGCRVVLTNPTSAPRRLELLLQIPAGALPLRSGFRTRSFDVALEPYATAKHEYAFYFPEPGSFEHYPAHASRDGALVASVPAVTRLVVPEAPALDTRSWEHVSQSGSSADVLAWLATANLERVDLGRIAWRLRERAFFDALLAELRRRHAWDGLVWSYALLHGDAAGVREFLRHQEAFLAACGQALDSPLLVIDPLERGTYAIVEFEPLFQARTHRFGGAREIHDRGLAAQYGALLELLAWRARPSDAERLELTCHLLMQDRVEEALAQFARVDPAQLATRLQHDYVQAYLGLFQGGGARSREIAQAWSEHPVERWRTRFAAVLAHLDEAEGRAPAAQPGDGGQAALAAAEPALELAVEGGRTRLAWRNLARCELRYYPLDVEFQFSTQPFARQDAGASSFVRAARSDVLELQQTQGELAVELPREFAGANVLVEARAGGLVRRQTLFASSLDVRTIDAYGQLVVSAPDGGRPLPQVYVKVFARTAAGRVRFHKDGYTDLRGRFDYASRTGAALEPAERYAILVLSESEGAVLREVAPPPQ